MNERRYTHLDLFSGIGGFSLAFEAEGFETIGFAEIDPYASAVLKKHWPNVPNYGDVRNVPAVRCDVLTGGFPCQPFSVAGKRRGKADDRAIWPEMFAVIKRCRPAFVLGENVPGIINMELDRVLSDLESEGYTCRPFVVPACAVDAKHRRDRVWIVAQSACELRDGHRNSGAGRRHEHTNGCKTLANASGRRFAGPGAWKDEQPRGAKTIGGSETLAHTNEPGSQRRNGAELPECAEQRTAGESHSPMADTISSGNADNRPGRPHSEARTVQGDIEKRQRIRPHLGQCNDNGGAHWLPEPELGRVANGIPNRAHRLKCLGNSIVPQVAQIFARAIRSTLDLNAL